METKTSILPLVALLSVRLALDKEVKNFQLSVFHKKWQSYGDIVLTIKTSNEELKYAIKCNQISETRSKIKSCEELVDVEKEQKRVEALQKNEHYEDTTFVIFTNAQISWEYTQNIDPNATIQPIKEKQHGLIKTSQEGKTLFEIPNKTGPNIVILINQIVEVDKIGELLNKHFEDHPSVVEATKEVLKYIGQWSKGELGGHHTLTKSDTILKIIQILLQEVVIEPVLSPKITDINLSSYQTWNETIKQVDLTVLKNQPYHLNRVSDPINKLIETIFNNPITQEKVLQISKGTVDTLEPEIKAYLFETVNNIDKPVSLSKLYRVLWKANRLPLLVKDRNGNFRDLLMNILEFMKKNQVKRQFIFCTDDPDTVTTNMDLKLFKNLGDIKNCFDYSGICVPVLNGPQINLEQICSGNPYFAKRITPEAFLNLTLMKCSIKTGSHKSNHEEDDNLMIILNDHNLLEEIYKIQKSGSEKPKGFGKLRGVDPTLFIM